MGILNGTRILDFSQTLAGAICTRLLAGMGAEIVKVDSPARGDTPDCAGKDVTVRYLETMRGKRSVIANINDAADKPLINSLIKTADGIVESFAPGLMAEYGFSYEDAAALKGDICYLSVTGFGQYGPYAHRPYNDTLIQALSGLMSITGEPDGPAMKAGPEIAEGFAGLFSAIGMVAMLRHKFRTGEGQRLDLAQLDCMVPPLENAMINYLATGKVPGRLGNRHRIDVPFQDFPTQNGDLLITVNRDNTFAALCRVLGCPQFIEDSRYADCESRRVNVEEIVAEIASRTRTWEIGRLSDALTEAGVPNSPINTVDKTAACPQIKARDMIIEARHPAVGSYKTTGYPLKFSKTVAATRLYTPVFGEDTKTVMHELEKTI